MRVASSREGGDGGLSGGSAWFDDEGRHAREGKSTGMHVRVLTTMMILT
jgi:hypothetical protein